MELPSDSFEAANQSESGSENCRPGTYVEESPLVQKRHWIRRIVNRLEIDRAVFLSIALRIWQAAVSPVTMLFITRFVTPEVQGFYYTFTSLMGFQAFFELGLHSVIANLASREWAVLSLSEGGEVTGCTENCSRLGAIWLFVAKWYFWVATCFSIAVGLLGWMFFSKSAEPVVWAAPWLILVVTNGLVLWTWAQTIFLEGCGQVYQVSRLRLIQGVIGSLLVWACLGTVGALWAIVVGALVRLFGDVWFLVAGYRRFFSSLWHASTGITLSWRTEILPLQWRVALRGAFGFLLTGLFIPVLFAYQGAAVAGRMGMTWTVLSALEQISFAWVGTRTPLMAMLVKQEDFRELDRVFFRIVSVSLGVMAASTSGLCFVLWLLQFDWIPYGAKVAQRLLFWDEVGVFCIGLLAAHVLRSLTTYLLIHMKDPLLPAALAACSAIGLGVWYFGQRGGVMSMALVFSSVLTGFSLPTSFWIWARCRTLWHRTGQ